MKKKTKLKEIEFSSVDMVRRGANQEADITLYKNEEGTAGSDPPSDAPEAPNTGDIPQGLWKSIVKAVKEFMGAAESHEEEPEEVEKAAETFSQKREQQEIRDDRWKYQDALNMSIDSILGDDDISDEEKITMIEESVNQFSTAYKEMCGKLLKARATADRPVMTAKSAETGEYPQDDDPDYEKEGEEEMKIDKSRFSPEELDQYNALIAKGKVEEEDDDMYMPEGDDEDEEDMNKKKCKKSAEMHPEVKKALEEMEALKKSMEMKELADIAKKYTLLGKKEDELANTLYEMKKSSQDSYDAYLAVLDQNLELVNKSGTFAEIGKSSRGMAGGTAEEKIEGIAKSYLEKDPSMDYDTAVLKAWENNPELLAECDKEYY